MCTPEHENDLLPFQGDLPLQPNQQKWLEGAEGTPYLTKLSQTESIFFQTGVKQYKGGLITTFCSLYH